MKIINKWNDHYDELEELQKIFFTFLNKWTHRDRSRTDPNAFKMCEVFSDEEPFELDETPFGFGSKGVTRKRVSTHDERASMFGANRSIIEAESDVKRFNTEGGGLIHFVDDGLSDRKQEKKYSLKVEKANVRQRNFPRDEKRLTDSNQDSIRVNYRSQ